MTTRLPQEVYEELGFTHEQFEKAMAMVQELGSNRAADRAMGLSSGTVARWARAWLLASRALEENPQADPREILAGLKLSRRTNLSGSPDMSPLAGMSEPDSPEALEALQAFRRGAGLVQNPQAGPQSANQTGQTQDSQDLAGAADLGTSNTAQSPGSPTGTTAPMTGLLDGLSARPRRVQRLGASDPPTIPRSLTGATDSAIPTRGDERLGSFNENVADRSSNDRVGSPNGASLIDSGLIASLQASVDAIGRDLLKPDAMAGLIDQVRRDIADLAQLTQQGLASNDQQALTTQQRLEALAQSLGALSEMSAQWARFDNQFGEGLKASLEPANAILQQVIAQHAGFASQIQQLQEGQRQGLEQTDPNLLANRVDALIGQVDLLARAADLGLVREQLASLQQLLQSAPLASSGGQLSSLGNDSAQVQQLVSAMDARLEQHWASIQTRLEQIYAQGSDSGAGLRNELASKHQVEMLRTELPAQFSTLNVRLEAMLNQQADEIRLHARVPAAVTERLQSQLSDLSYSIGRLLDKGQDEAQAIIQETRQIFGETRQMLGDTKARVDQSRVEIDQHLNQIGAQVNENLSQLGGQFTQGLVDVGRQIEQFDQRIDAAISAGLGQTQSLFVETRSLFESSQRLIVERTADLGLAREQINALQALLEQAAATAPRADDVHAMQGRLQALDQQFSQQIQQLAQLILERSDAESLRGNQLQIALGGSIAASAQDLQSKVEESQSRFGNALAQTSQELLSRIEALGIQTSGGAEALSSQVQRLDQQSASLLSQLESRLPETFGASFRDGLDRLSGLVTSLIERSNTDVGTLLAELRQVLESSRNLLIERTEVLVPALDRLGDLGAGLGQLQQRLVAIEQGGEREVSEAGAWRDEVRSLLGQTQGLIVERTAALDSAQQQAGGLAQSLDDLALRLEARFQAGQAQLQEGASRGQGEIQRLLDANRALLIDRSEVLSGAMAQLNDLRVPLSALEQRFEVLSQAQERGFEQLDQSLLAQRDQVQRSSERIQETLGDVRGGVQSLQSSFSLAQGQLASLQSAFAEAAALGPQGSELHAIRDQLAQLHDQLARETQSLSVSIERVQTGSREQFVDLRDEVATRMQFDLLKEDLPAQFSELSARIEAWFRRQAERSVEAEMRLPESIVGKIQNSWEGLTYSIAEVVRRGLGDSAQLFTEAKALLESSKTLIDERTDLLSLGITDVGSQLSQMDQKLGGVADRISALLGYLQRGGGEKLAVLMRDAEQKGLRIEQEQREVAEQQSRLLKDLRSELGSRLEQIQAGLQQPVDLLRQGLSSSSDALRGVIATGLDSVAVQLSSHQQAASERLAKLLDDVSLTAIRIEQGQQREATVLRSDMGNLAREINSDLQHTRDALQTNLSHSLSEVREISVLQQRSLSEILSQLQEHTATLMQSLSVSLEGLDKSFLNHIEKITGGQASMRENFAELAKTSLAFRRSSEQLTSLSRSIGRIERLASDVAGFGGQIQSLAQTAEKLQSDTRRSQQLEDQIVRLQASFQTFASSIARIDTLGPYIEQLHQESLKNVDFNAFLESLDGRFQPLATQAYAEKSTKLIATDLGRLQQMSGALQTLIEQHLQRLQVLEITVSQQIAERIEEGIRQQSLLREDLLNRAAQQDDLLRLSISQLIQNLEKATSPLARADLINQSIGQLKELQVGYQVQLEETSKQRQRELVDLLQGGQESISTAQRDGLRQMLDAGQDRYNKLLQLQNQLFEKQRDQHTQYHEVGQRTQQQWFDQAQTLIRRNHETLIGLAESQHQQSELLERDLHEQIQSLQRQHFTILKQLQDQNHSQVQSLQNSLQEKTEQLIRQLNADAQRSLSAEFNDVRQLQEQLTNALTERFDQSLEQIVTRSERGFMQLEALQPLLDQLRTDMLRPRHIEQVVADVRRELESVPRNIDLQTLQDRLSAKFGMSKDQLGAALVSVKDELSGLVESGNSRLFGISLVTEKLSERSEAAMGKLDHLTAALESVRTDTLRTRISDQNIGLERVTNLVNALQERLGAGLDTVLDRVMGMLSQQDKLAERTEDAQGRLQSLVSLAIEQAVSDIRRELYGVVRDSGLSALEDRVRTAIGDLQDRLVPPSDMAATQLNELRAHTDRLTERVDQSLQRVDAVMGLSESMRAEALRPRHLDQAMSEMRREFGPLARSNEIETVSERLRTLGLSSGKVEDQVTRIRAGLQGLENAFSKLDVLSSQVEQSRAESVKEQHIVEAVSVIRRDVEPLVKAGELSSMMVNTLLERLNSVSASNAKLEDRAQRLQSEVQMMHNEMSELRSMLSRIESKLER
jgi:DNA repair exonuclease SbcCD ATPase subunit